MLLSVVVTIVDGGDTLVHCLDALATQQGAGPLEVLVPHDDSVPGMAEVFARFPQFVFLNLGPLQTATASASPAGQHELFDRRRAAGLASARGDLVAILEDRGVPRPHWAAEARRLHGQSPHVVIGGAIENGCDRVLNWAVYFCDFGRYQRPFLAGPRPYVSDVNVCYKRVALEETRTLWQDRYHEPVVHGALLRSGAVLILSPDLIVDQFRGRLRLATLSRERVAWGRLFASLRTRDAGFGRCAMLAALSPLLPAVLFVRLTRMQLVKRVSRARFLTAAPAVAFLLCAWSLGEFLGYVTGARRARSGALPTRVSNA
jgi:hypothetical protein